MWEEFLYRLEGPEGCNFWEDDQGKIHWTCDGDPSKPLARAILEKMGVNVERTLAAIPNHYCDCEIAINLDD
jgi:hypothetical protein